MNVFNTTPWHETVGTKYFSKVFAKFSNLLEFTKFEKSSLSTITSFLMESGYVKGISSKSRFNF